MGIQKLFDYNLFKNMIHKTGTEVNEKATSAWTAASTIAKRCVSFCAMPESQVVQFHCNRPFFYTINDRVSQEVLFAGVFRGPE